MHPIQHQRHQRPSQTRSLRVTLAALALAASGFAAGAVHASHRRRAGQRSREEFRWQGQVQPGQNVEIRGVNGGIDAAPSSSGQIEVTRAQDRPTSPTCARSASSSCRTRKA